MAGAPGGLAWGGETTQREPPVTTGASRQAIEHHYDVGREFYRLWLDDAMVYSCAFWPGELDEDLEAAQRAKLDWHASAARVDGATAVLDVGCGWGALLAHLRLQRGVAEVTGLTLSSDQAETAAEAAPGAEVRLESWEQHPADRRYDAVISIGAFEHFARQGLSSAARRAIYRRFFRRCAGWLPPGGRLSLQSIAYEDFDPTGKQVSEFFTEEIFPESDLPRLTDVAEAFEPTFRLLSLRSDAEQYAHTLALWQRRLEAAQPAALELVDRSVYRRYLRYLRVSRALFERRSCTLYRLVLERRPDAVLAERDALLAEEDALSTGADAGSTGGDAGRSGGDAGAETNLGGASMATAGAGEPLPGDGTGSAPGAVLAGAGGGLS